MRGSTAAFGVPAAAAVLAGLVSVAACEDEPAPAGPPRCEPPEELSLERGLKRGFRYLVEGDDEAARRAFSEVLKEDPTHPEARAGLRLARDRTEPERRDPAPAVSEGAVVFDGKPYAVVVPVVHDRFRFEELRAQRRLAREMGLAGGERPVPTYFEVRAGAGGEPLPAAEIEAAIDLVVLHDSMTWTAREAFLNLAHTGGSTHFLVDFDGTVYQTLDLALEANHSGVDEIDARSVAVDVVNPVELDRPRYAPEVGPDPFDRPLSEFETVQGKEMQRWGYTPAQMDSLGHLARELERLLPSLPPELPGRGNVPRHVLPDRGKSFRGFLGHLHVSERAEDPGPGFDWSRLGTALSP